MSDASERAGGGESAELTLVETAADREQRNPFYRYLVHLGLPLSASIGVHLVLLAVFALVAFDIHARRPAEIDTWSCAIIGQESVPSAFSFRSQSLPDIAPDPAPPAILDPRDLSALRNDLTPLDEAAPGRGDGAGQGAWGFGKGVEMLGVGEGANGPGGYGTGIRGGHVRLDWAPLNATRIVYVVDYSGSIVVFKDDLRQALQRQIGRLVAAQSFNVILFNSTVGTGQVRTECFKGKLEPATDAARREFATWIKGQAPQGDTEPLPAIRRALEMNPQAVVFLSDGYFDDRIVEQIADANRVVRARIYTLVLDEAYLSAGDPAKLHETTSIARMRRIAQASGGDTRVVTSKDLTH